jgi:hypothetical protein
MFDVIYDIHHSVGHTGTSTMRPESKKKYANVTKPLLKLFCNYSDEFQLKKKNLPNHGLVVKPIRSSEFNSRWQMDLIDLRTIKDGKFEWIMNCQDHYTKFCMLEALEKKTAINVARTLYKLFGLFGVPKILQSDNGKEFRNSLVSNLNSIWPGIKLVHGRARYPASQGSVERSNADVQDLLGTWMRINKSTSWSTALPYIMYQKNRKHHRGKK